MKENENMPLFDEFMELLLSAGIKYHSASDINGKLSSGDKNIEAVHIFCNLIEKKITEAKIEIIEGLQKINHTPE